MYMVLMLVDILLYVNIDDSRHCDYSMEYTGNVKRWMQIIELLHFINLSLCQYCSHLVKIVKCYFITTLKQL